MKKFLSIILCLTMLFSFAVPCFAAKESVYQPVIIDTVFPTDDVVIADIIATNSPYNADNTGENDATSAIQKAIDDCFENGRRHYEETNSLGPNAAGAILDAMDELISSVK